MSEAYLPLPTNTRPLVAIMTDSGSVDGDVGTMKGVIAGIVPAVVLATSLIRAYMSEARCLCGERCAGQERARNARSPDGWRAGCPGTLGAGTRMLAGRAT
jgi:hypothetical protein